MSRICHSFMVWCGVLRAKFGGLLCAKKSRATFWPWSAPGDESCDLDLDLALGGLCVKLAHQGWVMG